MVSEIPSIVVEVLTCDFFQCYDIKWRRHEYILGKSKYQQAEHRTDKYSKNILEWEKFKNVKFMRNGRWGELFPFNRSTEECGGTRLHRIATTASDCNKNRHLSSGRAGWEEGSEEGDGMVVVVVVEQRRSIFMCSQDTKSKSHSKRESCT